MHGPILILVDIAHDDSAVELLSYMGERFTGSALHVAYVMPYGFYSYVEPYVSEDSQRAAADRAREELGKILERAGVKDLVQPHILRGGIGEQCLRLAEKLEASMVALNATRTDSAHVTLGTHAAQIARHAACSVHLYRAP